MKVRNDTRVLQRRKQIIDAWRTLAPAATLNGMTLDQFENATKTSTEVRQRIDEAQASLIALRQERLHSDAMVREKIADLVDAVKGSPEFGANSPLYSACGYVPRNARRSGLTRKGSKVTKPAEGANAA